MIPMLMDEKALKTRIFSVYRAMKTSAKPKLFKSGRRRGQIRVPGLDALPFTAEQFWQHALRLVGPGAIRCPYCEEVGRPANLITLANCVFDHKVPKVHAGYDMPLLQVWSLDNLVPVCADCNTLKGSATYAFFVGIMAALEKWEDVRDRAYIHRCLRTHGKTMQGFRTANKRLPSGEEDVGQSGKLALVEDF